MGLTLTEAQLKELLRNNSKLKISESLGSKIENKIQVKEKKKNLSSKTNKISLLSIEDESINVETKKAKPSPVKIAEINNINKSSIISSSVSDEHFSILFLGAKLLSVNQIFALLQQKYQKYELFSYKKIWHEIIKNNLDVLKYDLKTQGKELPYFNDSVEITLFRQASRLVDEDAMSTMFKYIIDGLKRDPIKNPNGILAEDNPKIVHRIVCYSEKGEAAVGIKVKKIEEKKKTFIAQDILKN